MVNSVKLGQPLIGPNAAAGYIVANGFFQMLDWACMPRVVTLTNTPPGSPAEADAYLLGSAPTGVWAGHADQLAVYFSGWHYASPSTGMRILRVDLGEEWCYGQSTYGWFPVQERWSVTEYWTGRFHGGGTASINRVYAKFFNVAALPNATTTNQAHGITNLDHVNIITLSGVAFRSAISSTFQMPLNTPTQACSIFVSGANLSFNSNADFSLWSAKVRMEYRKTS